MSTQTNFSGKYFYKENPKQESQYRYLIFDFKADLHFPLTYFGGYLQKRYALNTIRSYINEVISFFNWYHNERTPENEIFWKQEPEQIRNLVSEYLLIKFKCQIRNKGNYCLVYVTNGSPKTIGLFLAALRCFYYSTINNNSYNFKNPLIDMNLKIEEIDNFSNNNFNYPIMPYISGVSDIEKSKRLTESYFVLMNNEWKPHIINDNNFPNQIFNAGKLVNWTIRENLITMLLFETGARISEICGLTLGDWYARNINNEATSFSKGSFQRRVKFIRWSNNTTKLLKYYFDYERIKFDKNKLKLIDYINLANQNKLDLYNVKIFITNFGNPLKPNVYRDLYWHPACKKSNIRANIHQIRHWYVSKVIEEINSLGLTKDEYERKVDELIKYMDWRSGRRTLEVYEHFFEKIEHGLLQDTLHAKLGEQLKQDIKNPYRLENSENSNNIEDDPELNFLWGLGGSKNGK